MKVVWFLLWYFTLKFLFARSSAGFTLDSSINSINYPLAPSFTLMYDSIASSFSLILSFASCFRCS